MSLCTPGMILPRKAKHEDRDMMSEDQAQELSGHQLAGTRMDAIQGDAAGAVEKGADFDGGGFLGDGTKIQPALNQIWKVGHVIKCATYSTYGLEDMDATYQSRLNPATKDDRATDAGTRERSMSRNSEAPIDVAHRGADNLSAPNPGGGLQTTSDVGVRGAGTGTGEMEDNPITEVDEQGPQDERVRIAKGLKKRAAVATAWVRSQTSPTIQKLAQELQKRAYDVFDSSPEMLSDQAPAVHFKMPGKVKSSAGDAAPGVLQSAANALFEPLQPLPPSNPIAEAKSEVSDVRKASKLVQRILRDQPLI